MADAAPRAAPRADAALDDMDGVDDPPHPRSDETGMPTEAEVRAVLRDPPEWLRPVLENYRDEYARRGQIDGVEVVWRMNLRTVANNVASALQLSPTEGHRICPLVEKALADSEYAREEATA
jgi:hypothetical protein